MVSFFLKMNVTFDYGGIVMGKNKISIWTGISKMASHFAAPYRGLPKEIYIIFVSRVINSIGAFVHPLLVLILTEKIGLSRGDAGSYITVLSLLGAPSVILGGKLADTIGRKRIIIVSQFFGALALIACGFMKPNITMTYVISLSSLLYAMSSPAYDAMLADLTTPENRKGSFSLLYMGWNLGFALGPVIGGLLYKKYLPLVFIGDGLTTLISTGLVAIFVKETIVKRKIHESNKEVVKENSQLEKSVEGSVFSVLLQRPILIFFAMILFCFQFEYSQWGFTLPIHLGEVFKDSGAAYYGLLAGFNGLVVICVTPLLASLTHNIKPIKVIAWGGFCYGIAFGMLAFIQSLPLFFTSMFIMTVGEVMISINSSTFIANHTPASHRGRVSSVLPMIFGAGYTFGPMLMGKVIGIYNISTAWIMIGMLGMGSGILMRLLDVMDKRESAAVSETT